MKIGRRGDAITTCFPRQPEAHKYFLLFLFTHNPKRGWLPRDTAARLGALFEYKRSRYRTARIFHETATDLSEPPFLTSFLSLKPTTPYGCCASRPRELFRANSMTCDFRSHLRFRLSLFFFHQYLLFFEHTVGLCFLHILSVNLLDHLLND